MAYISILGYGKKIQKIIISLIIFVAMVGCSDNTSSNQDIRQEEIKKSETAAKAYVSAREQAEKGNPSGFLKLYEISKDDATYTAEYSEVSHDELLNLLYSKTDLWIKTFSQVNQEEFLAYLNQRGLGVSTLPVGAKSEKEVYEHIIINLNKIKGNKTEMNLINFIKLKLEKILEP